MTMVVVAVFGIVASETMTSEARRRQRYRINAHTVVVVVVVGARGPRVPGTKGRRRAVKVAVAAWW